MQRSPASKAPQNPVPSVTDLLATLADPVSRDQSPAAPDRQGVRGWLVTRLPLLVALVFAGYFAVESYALGLGTLRAPLSGLWPFIVSLVLMACALVGLFTCDPADVESFGPPVVRPALGLAALCLFVLLWDEVGLLLTGSAVLTFWFKVLARESWRTAVTLAVAASVGAHVLFVVALGARLPDDLVAQLWGG